LDREKMKAWLAATGREAILADWSTLPLPLVEWWFLSCIYLQDSPAATYLQGILQLTDEDMASLVSECAVDFS